VQALEQALEQCYIAVTEPALWGRALDALAASYGASGAMFYPKDVNAGATLVPFSSSYGELLEEYVAGRWYENHYRAQRGWRLLSERGQTFVVEHDLASDEERKRLAHYNELYLRFGFPGFAAVGFHVNGHEWCLPLLRSSNQGHFSQAEARSFDALRPHLARLMRLTDIVQHSGNKVTLQAFDNSGKAALVIGDDGRVVAMNERAGRLLDAVSDYLKIVNSRLVCTNWADNKALAHLVQSGTATKADWRLPLDPILYLARNGRAPISIELFAPAPSVRAVSARSVAILLIEDLDLRPTSDIDRLMKAYRLTVAEARFCALLVEGASVKEAAEKLEITEGTARQRLKAVFGKTSTNKQSDLLLALSRLSIR
jgi:DNA-binding CsgD family transcriptional regulator/PAS domain-containing protein